jgi:protoheme IX farnesyltransferase
MANKISLYYRLTKPGIIKGNLLTLVAGYLLASQGDFVLSSFVGVCLGTIFVIGAGCVFNNLIDREIDKKMNRTKNRATVTGEIPLPHIYIFGALLIVLGEALLYVMVNPLTALIGLFGFVMYVVVYGYVKRRSDLGTLVGAVPGAIPPVAGYTAVTNNIDMMATSLFLILVFWQMTHFYAIALFRKEEYRKAGIPVLSLTRGDAATKRHMYVYTLLFVLASCIPYILGYAGTGYLTVILLFSGYWIVTMMRNNPKPYESWARSVFGASLIVLLGFCLASLTDSVLI